MPDDFIIDFQPIGKRGRIASQQTLLDATRSAGIGLASVCAGIGTCEECRVQLISGRLSDPTLIEEAALGTEALHSGWRLACQARALSNVKLHIPPESLSTSQRLQTEGTESVLSPDPLCTISGAHGLAVDMGTTKLAAYLVNLQNGKTVARTGAMNPQIAYGEDLISRITYTTQNPKGQKTLQTILIDTLNKMLAEMCSSANIEQDMVLDAVLVGNTVMHHLAGGLPVAQLGQAPFAPATTAPISIPATQLGLILGPGALVYLPPVIAGYVGADHLAMLLATIIPHATAKLQSAKTTIALDIGTNTEISLLTNGRVTCCSCASGPAFEGAHIHEGMRASPGAVERVRWLEGRFHWQTIGDLPPIGFCGSGILDMVSALLDAGLVKKSGQLLTGNEYTLVPAERTGLGHDLTVTRKDVHEIQLAKAAIRAGVEMLLRNAGLTFDAVDQFFIAGAFGTYLDIRSAIRVGMFPPLPSEKFQQVGNAAGVGARQMLVSKSRRSTAEALAQDLDYLELATNKDFMAVYLNSLGLE
jgi:uncharacterized 2Fe-2S/4Fe-4S cluster protein (DUF4445 family)